MWDSNRAAVIVVTVEGSLIKFDAYTLLCACVHDQRHSAQAAYLMGSGVQMPRTPLNAQFRFFSSH